MPELFPSSLQCGDSPAQVLPSSPGYRENTQRMVVELLYNARRRVVFTTPYFIPDETLMQAMEMAVLRGVQVHLVVSTVADQFLVCQAQRSYYRDLLEAGVQIHAYRPRFLHAKQVTIDESIALVGSSNMDIRSFMLDSEVSVVIYDPAVVDQLRVLQEGYFAQSDRITLDQWNRRPFRKKVLQNTARLVDALL